MNDPASGYIFNIQRYSIHDGPGIRTVVFLKGCPLICRWCCNPESQRTGPELEFLYQRCTRCGRCLEACPHGAISADLDAVEEKIDRARCERCGRCAQACLSRALELRGERRSVTEVMAEVLKDRSYYARSGGGVTLSGGDPLAQPEFCRELLEACYNHAVHTAVETCGHAPERVFDRATERADLLLFDLKHMDDARHREATGVGNGLILANARRAAAAGRGMILRLPLIPGCNLDEENLEATAAFARELGAGEVHLMAFHQLGKDKYRRLGKSYELADEGGLRDTPEGEALVESVAAFFVERGLQVHVGG